MPRLKGIHYAIESGMLAAEAIFETLQPGETPTRLGALDRYDEALRSSYVWPDLSEVRNMRQVFDRGFFMGGALASAMIVSKGHLPPKDFPTHPNAAATLIRTGRAADYPPADGKLTFDKLSSVFASGNRTRDDQPNHLRIRERVPEGRRGRVGVDVPCPGLRGGRPGRRRDGHRAHDPLELRPVRRDQRQGRPSDPARGRRRPRVLAHLDHSRVWPEGQTLAVPEDDPSPVQVVRGELDADAIAGRHANPVTAHLPGGVRDQLVAVVERDAEHAAAQCLEHLTVHLDFGFCCDLVLLEKGCAA